MNILMIIPTSKIKNGQFKYSIFIKREIENLMNSKINVIPLYLTNRYNLKILFRFSQKVKKAIKHYNPDIVHIQTGTAASFLFFVRINIPIIITIGGSELLGYPGNNLLWKIRGKIASWMTIKASAKAKKLIVVSSNLKKVLPLELKKRATVIPRAVNTTFFKPMNKNDAKRKLGWNIEMKYIIFSDPRPHIGVKNRALAEMVIKHTSELLNEKIFFEIIYNKSPLEVLYMLNGSDALLVTSFHEGSPNIVKEAMACNLPIVSVNCGDVAKRLNNVQNCYVHDYDKVALANSLKDVLIKSGRSNGLIMLQNQKLTAESITKIMIETYNDLL
jgi:teichuronic acid biosynthesis glycosyltransferase TuaC